MEGPAPGHSRPAALPCTQVVIDSLDAVSGIQAGREAGLTGVWVDGAKVAAIGVRAKRWAPLGPLPPTYQLGPSQRHVP